MIGYWRIVSAAGQDLGVYLGETEGQALDALAREAGYQDQADAADVAGPFVGAVSRATAGELAALD